MRRRRNGGRERQRHGRGDGVSNRQREEKPERGRGANETDTDSGKDKAQGRAGRVRKRHVDRLSQDGLEPERHRGCRKTGSNGVRGAGPGSQGRGRQSQGPSGVGTGIQGLGSTGLGQSQGEPQPCLREEEREASQMMLCGPGVGQLMVRTALAYRRKEGTALGQGRSRSTDPGSQGDLSAASRAKIQPSCLDLPQGHGLEPTLGPGGPMSPHLPVDEPHAIGEAPALGPSPLPPLAHPAPAPALSCPPSFSGEQEGEQGPLRAALWEGS